MELEDAVHIALLTLKETIEGEMNGETVEIGKLPCAVDKDSKLTKHYRYHWTARGAAVGN